MVISDMSHPKARSQTSTDFMTLFYAFDEYTDVEDETTTRHMADIVMDGLQKPNQAPTKRRMLPRRNGTPVSPPPASTSPVHPP